MESDALIIAIANSSVLNQCQNISYGDADVAWYS